MTPKILNHDHANALTENLLDILRQEGYTAAEALPALMLAAADLVIDTSEPSQALDEAINVLVEEYEAKADEENGWGLEASEDDNDDES